MRPALLLSGYAGAQFWLLVCAFVYGLALRSTGLAHRLSLAVLAVFPGTYRGVLTAFLAIGLVLALGTPSMTMRTTIIVPTAWALTQALGLAPRSAGTALIVLTAIEMAVLPGCAFLTGSLYGPVVDALFRARGLELSWIGYAEVMALPVLLLSLLLVVINPLVLRPEAPLRVPPDFARDRLTRLSRPGRDEMMTAGVVILSTAYWATARLHGLPTLGVAAAGSLLFLASGIVRTGPLRRDVPWRLLLLLGFMFGVVNTIHALDVGRNVGELLAPVLAALSFSPMLTAGVAAVAMLAARFADPSGFVALAAIFMSLVDGWLAAGFPARLLLAPLLLASAPFWVTYQNIWVLIGEGVTASEAFTPRQRLRLAHTYAGLALLTLVPAVWVWRWFGLLSAG